MTPPPHTRPASIRPASPALPRAESLIDTALLWREFAYTTGCRFDVEKKALDAIVFTMQTGGHTLALPSKLEGTARRADLLLHLRRAGLRQPWQALTLSLSRKDGQDALGACWNTRLVGLCRPKHLPWLIPLLRTGRLACYVLAITGGTGHRRSLGCNVVYTGLRAALDAHRIRQRLTDRQAVANRPTATGSLTRVA